jgi:hypothetical protein
VTDCEWQRTPLPACEREPFRFSSKKSNSLIQLIKNDLYLHVLLFANGIYFSHGTLIEYDHWEQFESIQRLPQIPLSQFCRFLKGEGLIGRL